MKAMTQDLKIEIETLQKSQTKGIVTMKNLGLTRI